MASFVLRFAALTVTKPNGLLVTAKFGGMFTPALVNSNRGFHSAMVNFHFMSATVDKKAAEVAARDLATGRTTPEAPKVFYGCRRNLKHSYEKLQILPRQIQGLKVDRAILLMQGSVKKLAVQIEQVLRITRRNAEVQGKADPANLYILENYVTRGSYEHGVIFKARGSSSRSDHPRYPEAIINLY